MTKKFCVASNKDSADAYVSALLAAGYERVRRMEDADFLLYDHESTGRRREMKAEFMKDRPAFIYPHTPTTYWLWDGIADPLPVDCNFVAGKGAKLAMESYKYPNRVEFCGFPRCQIRSFAPTDGRDLLFVPARPRKDKGRQERRDQAALDWILEHAGHFDKITVCYLEGQFERTDYLGLDFVMTNPRTSQNPAAEMVERIDRADIVISTTTPAALAVARGKPTVFYGETETPETLTGRAPKSFEHYKHIYRFPLTLEQMDIGDVMDARKHQNSAVELWRGRNIGGPFDASKFLSIVREYV